MTIYTFDTFWAKYHFCTNRDKTHKELCLNYGIERFLSNKNVNQ